MKSWRTITAAAAIVATFPASAVFAVGACDKQDVSAVEVFPLVMCLERQSTTSNNVGNLYPWVNSSFFFATFRNQFLYPSAAWNKLAVISSDARTISSRSVSFTGGSVNNYVGSAAAPNYVHVCKAASSTLVPTFSTNVCTSYYAKYPVTGPANTVRVEHTSAIDFGGPGANPTMWSDFKSEAGATAKDRNRLTTSIPVTSTGSPNVMMDQLNRLGGGNSGFGVWDVTSGACTEPTRAFGSGQFANANHLTTALGIDQFSYVWGFVGVGLPPPITMEQQIAEILRLMLTPESLRCASLDTDVNGKTEDLPVLYPAGKDYDPISGYVTNNGQQLDDEVNNTGKARKLGTTPNP